VENIPVMFVPLGTSINSPGPIETTISRSIRFSYIRTIYHTQTLFLSTSPLTREKKETGLNQQNTTTIYVSIRIFSLPLSTSRSRVSTSNPASK
jgi:hypothetical protein